LKKIFSFFKRDYLRNEDGELRSREEVEGKIEETKRDCAEYYSLCVMYGFVCQYDVYVGVCFPEAAVELLSKGLHLDALNTEVFECKNKWLQRVIFNHTLRQGFLVWKAVARRNDEELFVHTHYPSYGRERKKGKKERYSQVLDNCLKRVEDKDETFCIYCLTEVDAVTGKCLWHEEMKKLRRSVQQRKLEDRFSRVLLGTLEDVDWKESETDSEEEENENENEEAVSEEEESEDDDESEGDDDDDDESESDDDVEQIDNFKSDKGGQIEVEKKRKFNCKRPDRRSKKNKTTKF
jgi:hypothetical protein